MPDNTAKEQRGKPFKTGESGNPSGRPKGSLNKTTLALQALLDDEAESVTRKAIEMALGGDITAIRLVLERILPPRKDRPVNVDIRHLETAQDITQAVSGIFDAVTCGDITPLEAKALTSIVDDIRKSIETQELEQRLLSIEQKLNEGK